VTRRPIWELVLAAVGASFLLVVAVNRWGVGGDEHAYWLAARRLIEGQPLYDPAVSITTPYAYLYAPPLAQAMVPFALVLPDWLFDAAWTTAMLLALWWLAGRDVIRALALVAFPPVAVEFWFRNVHLFLAILVVLGLRQWPGWYAVGAGIKVSPGLGIAYDALRGRWRRAGIGAAVGLVLLVVSVVLSPDAWTGYVDFVRNLDLAQQTAFVAIPFLVRLAIAVILVVVASRLLERWGELLLVVAVTLALPSLWFTGLSLLTAAVPLWRRPPSRSKVAA
jgi:hypothetical protein